MISRPRGAHEREQGRGSFPPTSATSLQAPGVTFTPALRMNSRAASRLSRTVPPREVLREGSARGREVEGRGKTPADRSQARRARAAELGARSVGEGGELRRGGWSEGSEGRSGADAGGHERGGCRKEAEASDLVLVGFQASFECSGEELRRGETMLRSNAV